MRIIACLLLLFFATLIHHSANASSCYGNIHWYGSSLSSGPTNTTEFQQNLNIVLDELPSNETEIKLYGEIAYHHGVGLNVARSKGRCIGYVDNDTCQDCIRKASGLLKDHCFKYADSGLLLYEDYCMVHYSNQELLETVTMPDNMTFMTNDFAYVVPSSSTNEFNGARMKLFTTLAEKAKERPGGYQMFATGKWNDESSNYTIYGASQCSPFLNADKCTSCLDIVSKKLEDNFDGKVGGSIVGPSCNFQYDVKPIIDNQSVAVDNFAPSLPPPSAAPPPQHVTTGSPLIISTRLSKGEEGNNALLVIYIVAPLVILSIIIFVGIYMFRKKTNSQITRDDIEMSRDPRLKTEETKQYDFRTISAATDKFSDANKLGRGGFGTVYKGKLQTGREIAVKRLSKTSGSGQGKVQFKNEVKFLATLQHINLVKLRGFCMEKKERLLIYEFVPNSSLDKWIFDSTKRAELKWDGLFKIIAGVTKGLIYLHAHSRVRTVHCDLKSENILLDSQMTPKIADFGLAKLIPPNETHGNTSSRLGTP